MKVLQLIDSLQAGGAEHVAVNYANALAPRIEASFLCSTREEGMLKTSLSKDVQYLFLNKKTTTKSDAVVVFVFMRYIPLPQSQFYALFLPFPPVFRNPSLARLYTKGRTFRSC